MREQVLNACAKAVNGEQTLINTTGVDMATVRVYVSSYNKANGVKVSVKRNGVEALIYCK